MLLITLKWMIYSIFFQSRCSRIRCKQMALAEVMGAANKYKIKYVIEGHSFLTEGITPLGKIILMACI